MKNILITGGCGFIGHHLVKYLLETTDHNIYIIDKLSYASFGLDRLRDIEVINNPKLKLFIYDLASKFDEGFIKELCNIQWIIHLAAETHIDKSIQDPYNCIMNNIQSTVNLLELARKLPYLEKFLYFSTYEVYGPAINNKMFTENDKHNPTNPYSASKSASEMICNSYKNTFNIPLIICNSMNVFGERQYNEKFIPKCIKNMLNDKHITIHCYPDPDTDQKSGSRFYIYVENVISAITFIMNNGELGKNYNIEGQDEVPNDVICDKIATILGKTANKIYINNDENRQSYDIRYCIDGSKLKKLGWRYNGDFDTYLKKVVEFHLRNPLTIL